MVCADNRCVPDHLDGGVDAGPGMDAFGDAMVECSATLPCTDPATPVCDMNVCRGCAAHDECTSGICATASGTCVDAATVTYVAADGRDESGCGTQTSPCRTINFSLGLVTTAGAYLHLGPGTYLEAVVIDGKAPHMVGPGAEIVPPQAGSPAVEIANAPETVIIESVTMRGATGSDGDGLRCVGTESAPLAVTLVDATVTNNEGDGIDGRLCDVVVFDSTISMNGTGVTSDRTILVEGSTIRANTTYGVAGYGASTKVVISQLSDNGAGGVRTANGGALRVLRSVVSGNGEYGIYAGASNDGFAIVNNVVVGNGTSATGVAGVVLEEIGGASIFQHNTVVNNEGSSTSDVAGIQCVQFISSQGLSLENNIVWGNDVQIRDENENCDVRYSNVQGGVVGEGNLNSDPRFVDAAGGDFHLTAASPCRNTADPESAVIDDIDGDARPTEDRSDVGADELVP